MRVTKRQGIPRPPRAVRALAPLAGAKGRRCTRGRVGWCLTKNLVLRRRTLVALLSLVSATGCGARTPLRVSDAETAADATHDVTTDVQFDTPIVDVRADAPRDVAADVRPERPALGCLDDPTRCDDRDVCTDDTCLADGSCAHTAVTCDDGDACTDDRCDPARGCFTTETDCDDRSMCTLDRCDPRVGCLRAPVRCDDGDPCTSDRCEPAAGCVFFAADCGGCADGSRDAFRDRARFPRIAGCAGGFVNAGLSRESSPTCGRAAGDDGPNPSGTGCSATDLCAPGWHVCRSASDVASHSPNGCEGARDAEGESFFATRQTGPGCGHCATGSDTTCDGASCRSGCAQTTRTSNDIFGCGTLGGASQASSCAPLDRFSNNLCSALAPPWRCDGDPNGLFESDLVVKPGPERGGVLCCAD